jgi:hypothetical protein
MPRVTAEDIREIFPTTTNPLPFILAASLLVDTYQERAGWSLGLATEIERWWTAHLMAVASNGAVTRLELGNTTVVTASPKLGDGLKGTPFGQQVLLMDQSGTLENVGLKRATIDVF